MPVSILCLPFFHNSVIIKSECLLKIMSELKEWIQIKFWSKNGLYSFTPEENNKTMKLNSNDELNYLMGVVVIFNRNLDPRFLHMNVYNESFAQACLLLGTAFKVSCVADRPLVILLKLLFLLFLFTVLIQWMGRS